MSTEGLAEGQRLRDEGMGRVLNAAAQEVWRESAYQWLSQLPPGTEVTATDLIEARGMAPSPNAVGAVMRGAAMKGFLEPTGRYTQSTRPIAHASAMRVWRAV